MKLKIFIVTILVTLFFVSCTFNTKFNKQQWQESSDVAFTSQYRTGMLKDLTENHKLKGLTVNQLNKLLGPADNKENNSIYYKVIVDYGSDIDPVYKKDLVFNYSKDSIITSFKIREWKKLYM